MADILKEKVININGVSWVRTHGVDPEGSALCNDEINPDVDEVSEGVGQITCPDCIRTIKMCKSISDEDLLPEYKISLFLKRFNK